MRTSIRSLSSLLLSAALVLCAGTAWAQTSERAAKASPYRILQSSLLETPPIEAFATCIPVELEPELERISEISERDLLQARAILAPLLREPVPNPDARLLDAVFAARVASGKQGRTAARKTLRELVESGELRGESAACAQLELARLQLHLGRYPEAAAHSVRAKRLAPTLAEAAAVMEAAEFYRTEGLYFAGHFEDARVAYVTLTKGRNPRTTAAARLRLADIQFDRGQRVAAREEYETLLIKADAFGASEQGWALRAAEAAYTDKDLAAAANWVERFLQTDASAEATAVAGVRLADFFADRGDADEARTALEVITEEQGASPVGVLASVRTVDLGVSSAEAEAQLELLRKATQQSHRGVAIYARAVLGHALREFGRVDEAVEVLSRLAYESPPVEISPHLSADIDAVMALAVADAEDIAGCARLVKRVGERRSTLIRYARSADNFLHLGQCYSELGLHHVALEVYRLLTKEFGTRLGEEAALPVARAALAIGDVGLARTAAAAGVRRGGSGADHWKLLLGESEVAEGRWERAAELLVPLVRAGTPKGEEVRSVVALARTAMKLPSPDRYASTLASALDAIPEQRGMKRELVGEASLLAAEALRSGGDSERAVAYYQRAVDSLSSGAMRAEAAYWLGALHPDETQGLAAWELAARIPEGGSWSRLATTELEMSKLRGRIGREPRGPASPEALR